MNVASRRAASRKVPEDYGFFGPNSVTWRVWAHPSAFIGFQRAVTIETLDPFLTAAVMELQGVLADPRRRFDRTVLYFATIAFGDGRSAVEASERLTKIHRRAVGIEPVSGLAFDANNPDSQLWIHMTAWHSILICYERYGPGRLSATDEARYWADCAVAAELQTCDPAKVPRSRAEVREYFSSMRPRLALSEDARQLFHYFLRPAYRKDARLLSLAFRVWSYASIATMPRWMRQLAGVDQNRLIDAAVGPFFKISVRIATPVRRRVAVLDRLAPSARPVIERALRGAVPVNPHTVTPAAARGAIETRTAKLVGRARELRV